MRSWRVLLAPFSFEGAFLVFLFAGAYKADPNLAWFPVDMTVFFFVVSLLAGFVIICREGIFMPGLAVAAAACLFVGWAVLTSAWTPGIDYAQEKLGKLTTLTLWSVIATAMVVAGRPERIRRFLLLLLILGTAASLNGIFQYATAAQAFSAAFRLENYGGQARLFGMAALVALVMWLRFNPLSPKGLASLVALAISVYGLLITGGRGPALATLAAMMLPLALGIQVVKGRLLVSRFVVAAVVLLALAAVILAEVAMPSPESFRTVQRFNVLLTEEGGGGSAAGRMEFWQQTIRLWFEQPLVGHGNGSWPIIYFGVDVKRHPHNVILEVLAEYGLIGLLLLLLMALAACSQVTVQRLREEPYLMCAAMLAMSAFLSAMTSSDLTENRQLFAMVGLLAMLPVHGRSHVATEDRAYDLGSSGERYPDLHQAVPDAGRGRL